MLVVDQSIEFNEVFFIYPWWGLIIIERKEVNNGSEIRSSILLEGKVPVLQDISPLSINAIRDQKYRVAIVKKSTAVDDSLHVCLFAS